MKCLKKQKSLSDVAVQKLSSLGKVVHSLVSGQDKFFLKGVGCSLKEQSAPVPGKAVPFRICYLGLKS